MHDKLRDTPLPTEERINLVDVCRQIMRIVARLETQSYTDFIDRQTAEWGLDDPADPASANDTAAGLSRIVSGIRYEFTCALLLP